MTRATALKRGYRWASCFLTRQEANRIVLVIGQRYNLRYLRGRYRVRAW